MPIARLTSSDLPRDDPADRAVGLPAPGGFPISVLHPIDLAIAKAARLQDHDRADIAALGRLGVFSAEDFAKLSEEALADAVGELTFTRHNLRDAVEIVATAGPGA